MTLQWTWSKVDEAGFVPEPPQESQGEGNNEDFADETQINVEETAGGLCGCRRGGSQLELGGIFALSKADTLGAKQHNDAVRSRSSTWFVLQNSYQMQSSQMGALACLPMHPCYLRTSGMDDQQAFPAQSSRRLRTHARIEVRIKRQRSSDVHHLDLNALQVVCKRLMPQPNASFPCKGILQSIQLCICGDVCFVDLDLYIWTTVRT
jgi:hypothetical protein